MIYLVIGTSDSGKSALAEELAVGTEDGHKVYLATMKICDEAGKKRVERHRAQRAGKGFETIEMEYDICTVLESIDEPQDTTILLECVSNLVGNEMYDNPHRKMDLPKEADLFADEMLFRIKELAEEIASDVKVLADAVSNIVMVTNEYEKEAEAYDDETRLYVQLLSIVNEKISTFSDKVIKVGV